MMNQNLAGVAHDGVAAVEHGRGDAVDRHMGRRAGFAERELWNMNIRPALVGSANLDMGRPDYLAHFSVSSAMSFLKSAGEPASTSAPRSAIRAFILGSARAALISLLSLSTISAGVFSGAPMPEVAPGYGTTGLSGGAGCSVMVDGADNEENQTEVRCRREGEDSA